jgi:hypothetical protein
MACERRSPNIEFANGEWNWKHTRYRFRFRQEKDLRGKLSILEVGSPRVPFYGKIDLSSSDQREKKVISTLENEEKPNMRDLLNAFTLKLEEALKGKTKAESRHQGSNDFQPIFEKDFETVDQIISGVADGISWEATQLIGKTNNDGKEIIEKKWVLAYYDSENEQRDYVELPDNKKEPIDLSRVRIHYSTKPQQQPGLMTMETMKAFLDGDSPTFVDCFLSILESEKKWMEYRHEEDYWVNAWRKVQTFFFDLFNTTSYTHLHGARETGKSRYLKLMASLSYHGLHCESMTEATIFRLIEANKTTLCIDEFETPTDDQLSLINQGYKKGGSVPRCDESDGYNIRFYDVFCPKAMASIQHLNPTTQSRCLTQIMLKSRDNEKKDREEDFSLEEGLKQKLYILRLVKLSEVAKTLDTLRRNPEERSKIKERFDELCQQVAIEETEGEEGARITGRLWELVSSEFILSEFMEDSDIRERLQRKLASYMIDQARLQETETTQDSETIVLTYLVNEGIASTWVYLSNIEEDLKGTHDWMNARYLGSLLKRLGFDKKRRAGPSGRTQVFIPEKELLDACMTYRIPIPEDKGYKIEDYFSLGPKTPSEPSEPSEPSVEAHAQATEETEETEETEAHLDPKTKSGIAEDSTQKRFFELVRETQKGSKEDQDRVMYEEFRTDYDKLAKHHQTQGNIIQRNPDSPWRLP